MRISFRLRTRTTTTCRRAAVILLASALSAGLTSCTGTADPTPTSSPSSTTTTTPSPSPTKTLTAKEEKLKELEPEVLEAYQAYWEMQVRAFAAPNDFDPLDVMDVATGDAFNSFQHEVFSLRTDGVAFTGQPVLSPEITDFVDDDGEQTATIRDCLDVSDWQPIFTETSESAAQPGQGTTRVTTATAVYFDGKWVISSALVDRSATC